MSMIHVFRAFVCVALAAVSFSCDVPEFDVDKVVDRAAIRIARNRWHDQNIHDYEFVYSQDCDCPAVDPAGVRVDVEKDVAISAVGDKDGIPYPDAAITIDGLFDKVLAKTENGADKFDVHFNDERRFIDRITVDPDENTPNDQYSFTVPCFAPDEIPASLANAGVGGFKLSTGGVGGVKLPTGGTGGTGFGSGGGVDVGDKVCPYPLITADNCAKQNGTVTPIPATSPSTMCGSGKGVGQVVRDESVCCIP